MKITTEAENSTRDRIIWLSQVKTFIKITDDCSSRNNGLITLQKLKPVWLSLKMDRHSPSYLINEILVAGGDFCSEIGYTKSPTGRAICDGGVGYQGGVPFSDLSGALEYLAQYFDVRWCGEHASPDNKKQRSRTEPSSKGVRGVENLTPTSLIPCAAKHLETLLAKGNPSKNDFDTFYKALKKCGNSNHFEVEGAVSHLESSWGIHPGVYVVRKSKLESLYDSIVYVGMTGKITRKGAMMTGKLKFRPRRWKPYRFSKKGFEYDYYKEKNKDHYRNIIGHDEFIVDCFPFDASGLAAPSFFEAALLQAYALIGPNRLPPANNAF